MDFLKNLFSRKPRVQRIDITRRFELISRIGQGSMSKVWRARDSKSARIVALKVLDYTKTKRLEARFVGKNRPSEGEVALQLQHPNIVRTNEIGVTTDDEQFLVMEFVEGVSLSFLVDVQNERMRSNCLSYMIQLGEAIAYLHQKNYIHRDVCPRNALVADDNTVKLIDFGLVVPNTPPFQAPGNRTGTANYMAPELIKRQRTDQRLDIFSFAITCFEAFTKQYPWEGAETIDMVVQHVNTPPTDIREHAPQMDAELADIIMRGLERDPRDRWQKLSEMLQHLRTVQARLNPVATEKLLDPSAEG